MGMNLIEPHDWMVKRRTASTFDNFDTYSSGALWTSGTTGGGASVANNDGVGGLLTLTTGATLNNEAWVASTRKNWKYLASQPLVFEARINYAEGSTNKAGVAVGFSSAFAAALLQDTTLDPATNFSGALIYKKLNETVWRTASSLGTTQTLKKSNFTAGGTTDQVLRIEIRPTQQGGIAEVTYWVDGQELLDVSQTRIPTPIKDLVTYSGAAAMALGVFAKAGSGTSEVVNIDYIGAMILRTAVL